MLTSFTGSEINLTLWFVQSMILAIVMTPSLGSQIEQRDGQGKKKRKKMKFSFLATVEQNVSVSPEG